MLTTTVEYKRAEGFRAIRQLKTAGCKPPRISMPVDEANTDIFYLHLTQAQLAALGGRLVATFSRERDDKGWDDKSWLVKTP